MNKKEQGFSNKMTPMGVVYRRLYDTLKLKALIENKTGLNFDEAYKTLENGVRVVDFDVLCTMALQIMTPEELLELREKSAKKMFANNKLWNFLKKKFDIDLVIPFITGYWTTKAIKGNLITAVGHAAYAGQISGATSAAFTAIAYGTGAVAAATGDTALGAEVSRGAATVTRNTISFTNDQAQWAKTFTAGGTQAITEEGILDNNSTGGNLLARQVFTAVNMVLNDTLAFTHKIQS